MSNDPSIVPIARLRGEFACASTELRFLNQQGDAILRDLRRALALCSLFYVGFGVADILALGWRGAIPSILARLTWPLLAFLGLRHAQRAPMLAKGAFQAASVCTALGMCSYAVVVVNRPGDILLHGMSISLMSVVTLIFIPNRLVNALAIALGSSVGILLLGWYQHMVSTRHLISMSLLILFANLFGAIAANRHARLWREQYLTQQVLTNLSIRDPLTGCFNRRHLNAALLDGELARARRYRLHLSLIMCDLDGFKKINDTHGHHAGDELLRAFAELLRSMTREPVDTVVRYGGEEFLIILPETTLDGAVELAERVRVAFAQLAVECGGATLSTTASFGVVGADFARHQAVTPHALIAEADQLMYDAKHGGRNQVRGRQLGQNGGEFAQRAA
ncbi:GGDEF domain-containing protein [Massilia sp. 9096]|uniref:GGDEF domain-containing protein n=1 Tax=Massilia sp. 9096 TaxID=1500894 RepID=UPI00056251C9|nr:GGDEF domain-containing protein [Massilia sp. 9096]